MTVDLHGSAGASSDRSVMWDTLPWASFHATVKRLQMRIAKAIPILLCMAACSRTNQSQRLPFGDDPSWISEKDAVQLCEQFLRKQGYTNAYCISEAQTRGKIWYEFATNGTPPPTAVMVDRKTRKVSYGDWRHQE